MKFTTSILLVVACCLSLCQAEDAAPSKPRLAEDMEGLVAMLASENYETRASVGHLLTAEGLPAVPMLEKLAARLKDDPDAQSWVQQTFRSLRAQLYRVVAEDLEPTWRSRIAELLNACSADSMRKLGVAADAHGAWYFTFATRTLGDHGRLNTLEYLVAPPSSQKDHELLVSIDETTWSEFEKVFKRHAALRMRWREKPSADQTKAANAPKAVKDQPKEIVRELVVAEALPWAKPIVDQHGLCLGPNTDERTNKGLPPENTDVELWMALPGK